MRFDWTGNAFVATIAGMSPKKPNPTGFRFSAKQKARLGELADLLKKTQTEIVKEAILEFCKKRGLKFPGDNE